MTKIVLALLPLFALHLFSSAQAPAFTIRGNISDAYTNERLTGVTVSLAETRHGSVSALDGSYLLRNVAAGTYRMRCKFLGYEVIDTTISVKGNMVIHFTLRSSSVALQETVIAGKQDASTDAAARRSEQHALNITNIVSAKAIQLSPDITIANVLQRVSGVSVERSSSGTAGTQSYGVWISVIIIRSLTGSRSPVPIIKTVTYRSTFSLRTWWKE